jgi:hypothetical protein
MRIFAACSLLLFGLCSFSPLAQEKEKEKEKAKKPQTEAERLASWEKNVSDIEKRLKETKPGTSSIFFAGSSSIVRWDLAKSFPDLPVVKVGFGGSQIRDTTHYSSRIILPFQPKWLVFYAGDNDIAANRPPKQVFEDFQKLAELLKKESPATKILFISIKPSPKRFKLIDKQREANALIRDYCKEQQFEFLDLFSLMLDAEGNPKPGLYDKDELHLSPEGYQLWTEKVRERIGVENRSWIVR